MDEDADTRGNDDNNNDNAGGIEGGGTGEVFAWAADLRNGASLMRDDDEEEDPLDSSEDGKNVFLDVILKKRKDAIEHEAQAKDGQAGGGGDIPREVRKEDAEQLVPQRIDTNQYSSFKIPSWRA